MKRKKDAAGGVRRRRSYRAGLAHAAHITGVNTPIALGVSMRAWTLAAGLLTLYFVVRNLSPVVQGYYYTFGSLTQFTTLVDLGLQILVVQFASHETPHLAFDRRGNVSGSPRAIARLVSIGRFSLAWFGVLSIVLVGGLIAAGYWLFPRQPDAPQWQLPWLILCGLVAVDLWLNNFIWLLEGTNHLVVSYTYRLGRAVVGAVTLWLFLQSGFGLMSLPLSFLASVVFLAGFLMVSRPQFVALFFRVRPGQHAISWRREILPLQWRLGVSQVAGFASYSLFVPITFKFVGPVAAGQFGLSWSLVEAGTGVALLWPAVKFPTMGALASRRDWHELDRLALRTGVQATILSVIGMTALLALNWGLRFYGFALAGRLLPMIPLAFLAAAAISKIIQSVMIYYLRAHRQEPIVGLSAMGMPIMLGAIVGGAILYGVLGVTVSYFAVMTFFYLPGVYYIMIRCRLAWHKKTDVSPTGSADRALGDL